MFRIAALEDVPFWFVVFPDSESTGSAYAGIRPHADREIAHISGRPWLVGRWPDGQVAASGAGSARIAVLGEHAVSPEQLAAAAGRLRSVADVDRFARSLTGSAHVVASAAGQVRAQGTVTGVRRVYHARVGDVVIAADRADVLAGLLGAPLDERRLALQLLEPPILYPLAGQPVWRGVELLPTDSYLVLDPDGRGRRVRWWLPPEPVVPMVEGAPALRDALAAAVDTRVRGRDLVSCDLGGLDSTSVCCLAARGGGRTVAYTAASQDPLADDVAWARRTVAAFGNIEHHVIPAERMPLVYHGMGDMDDVLDEPCAVAVDRDRWLVIAQAAAKRGSTMHLCGFGGDELLYGSLAHLHTLLRRRPRVAARQLRGFTAKYRWPRGRVWRQLLDNRSYAGWLEQVAADVVAPAPPPNEPLLDWGFAPRLPPWAASEAVAGVRELMRAEARDAEPLAPHRGRHRELEAMRFVSRLTRHLGQMAKRLGLTLAAPYYDDRVVEAGLAVRPEDRITPWRYKPLIIEAMRGVVPDDSLTRQTKANGTCDDETGMRRHRADLLALWEDSRLGRLGLIDAAALREVCGRPLPPDLQSGVLYQTVACEMWLRSLEGVGLTEPKRALRS